MSGHLLGNSYSLGLRYVLFVEVPDCQLSFFPPQFFKQLFVLGISFLLRHFLIIAHFYLLIHKDWQLCYICPLFLSF